MSFVELGPGTLTLAENDYSCEVLGGSISHTYDEVGSSRTMLCGTERGSRRRLSDAAAFSLENDLTAAGLYQWLQSRQHDLAPVDFEYVPNTGDGAKWSGQIVPLLPGSIGADEYGAPIASDVEWPGVGRFTFTPAGA